jgi:hypothetical protein
MRKKITYMIVEEATQPCFSDPNWNILQASSRS